MIPYILYKNPIQLDTLYIVQYLHSLNIKSQPLYCIERNYPSWVSKLPSIKTENNEYYNGLEECIEFFERKTGIEKLYEKAQKFKIDNPDFRINN